MMPMELPQTISALSPRHMDDIAAAAHAVQANVVALKVADAKHRGIAPQDHDIRTPAPGPVRRSRDILIDHRTIKAYSDDEVVLRLRQTWGQFCALCWLFPFTDPQLPPNYDSLLPEQDMRCIGDAHQKLEQVQTGLWRLRHEQRLRHDPKAARSPRFQREHEFALSHPIKVYGARIDRATDRDILCCACEYAGMLAALRWATDRRWAWDAPGIMDVVLHMD